MEPLKELIEEPSEEELEQAYEDYDRYDEGSEGSVHYALRQFVRRRNSSLLPPDPRIQIVESELSAAMSDPLQRVRYAERIIAALDAASQKGSK